jgi:hypothetical protein
MVGVADPLDATLGCGDDVVEGGHQSIMLAYQRTDVAALNAAAHTMGVQNGEVRADGIVIAGQQFGVGDRVLALHKYGRRGEIVYGTRATITDVDPDADPGGQQGVQGAQAVEPERQPGVPARQPGGVEAATPATPQRKRGGEGDPSSPGGLPAARSGIFTHPASL